MTIISPLPYTFTNGTTIDAVQVDANDAQIVANVNANAAHNGANSDITALTGLTTPVSTAQGGTGQTSGVPSVMSFGPGAGGTVGVGTTVYLGPIGANAAEGTVSFPMPFAGTVRNMYTTSSAFAGAGQNYTYTLRKGGVGQTLQVVVTGAAAATGNDTTHSVSFSAGDVLGVQLVTSAGSGVGSHTVCVEIDKTP